MPQYMAALMHVTLESMALLTVCLLSVSAFCVCRLCVVVLNIPLVIIATRGYEVSTTEWQW
jgi:hypothetical protein